MIGRFLSLGHLEVAEVCAFHTALVAECPPSQQMAASALAQPFEPSGFCTSFCTLLDVVRLLWLPQPSAAPLGGTASKGWSVQMDARGMPKAPACTALLPQHALVQAVQQVLVSKADAFLQARPQPCKLMPAEDWC